MKKKKKQKSKNIFIILVAIILSIIFITKMKDNIEIKSDTMPVVSNAADEVNFNINKKDYINIDKKYSDINEGELILVNGNYKYKGQASNITSLFNYKEGKYKVKDKNVSIKNNIIDELNDMLIAYVSKTKNYDITVISGYRSVSYQKEILERNKKQMGEMAETLVAKPGHSEHHTGYAVDFGIVDDVRDTSEFNGEGNQKWLVENAYKYGFIVRYASDKMQLTGIANEPWHFRYIGKVHAKLITEKGMCLEEYIEYLKQFEFGVKHLVTNGYEVYYFKANQGKNKIPVPKDKKYEISGNNVDGFIVTFKI